MAESPIKRQIIQYLDQLPQACFMTRLSGSYRGLRGGRVINAGKNGAPDIIGVYRGWGVAIETKDVLGPRGGKGGAVQRASQIAFELEWVAAQGIYVLARSLEDVILAMRLPVKNLF